jgi:hypothetical protein
MTITFKNDSDVIIYALEKIISWARSQQYLFVANCAWWLAGVTGLDSGLIIHIGNLETRRNIGRYSISPVPRDIARSVSPISREPLGNQQSNQGRETAREPAMGSGRARNIGQRNRVNPLPQSKSQLKKARKVKRLQEENRKKASERNQRLEAIRAEIIKNLDKE